MGFRVGPVRGWHEHAQGMGVGTGLATRMRMHMQMRMGTTNTLMQPYSACDVNTK